MINRILSRSKKNIQTIKCFIEITEQLKKVKKRNMKYVVTKKRSKYFKKVSDQRKNKKTSCKIERYATRLHNSRKMNRLLKFGKVKEEKYFYQIKKTRR